MATTPVPLIWDFWRKSAQTAVSTGGLIDYYDTKAQELLPPTDDGGISSSDTVVENGHWQDAEWSEHDVIDSTFYSRLDFDHPARGAWYGVADLPQDAGPEGSGYDTDTFWLLKYEYEKRLDPMIMSGSIVMQTESPIRQLNLSLINTGRQTFLSESSLFSPGAKIETGLLCGNSEMYPMGIYYIDEVGYDVLSETVSVSARNAVGYKLATQTFDADSVISGRISECVTGILAYFGITDQSVEIVEDEMSMKFDAGTTGIAALQQISEYLARFDSASIQRLWSMGETAEGKFVAGYQDFFQNFLPNDYYVFDLEHEVFRYSVNRCADEAYTKVRMTGTDSDGEALEPVVWNVPHNAGWNLGEHRTYHGSADGVTQQELSALGTNNALMLAHIGDVSSVTMSIRPQLLIGDYAQMRFADGEIDDAGIITSITHRFGESGFFTDFTADRSGAKWASGGGHIVTRNLSVNGSARKSNITDYFMKKKG